jgi:RND family efflux transporter MFP subunit
MKSKFTHKNNLRALVIAASIFLQPQFIAAQSVEILEAKLQKSFLINKEFPGILHPSQQSKISFQIPGRVASVNVDIGDVVTKNQILAKLDDSEISAQLKQAKARFNLSKQILKRVKDLKIDGHVSDQQLDEANSEFLTAQSQLEYYQVKLDQAKLVAPYDGVIQGRFLDSGTVINGGVQILEIIDSRFVEAHVTLPMEYISKVELGQTFKFKVSNKTYNAILKRNCTYV